MGQQLAGRGDDEVTVLVAEDQESYLKTIELWLDDYENVDLRRARDGKEAINALEEDIDVFLCDRRMPGVHGRQVIHRLHEDGYDVPVVVLSAYAPDPDVPEDAVTEYLQKPVEPEDVIAALERAISA